MDASEFSRLLIVQHRKALAAVDDVLRHDLQFQAVVERRKDLLLRVVEVRCLI